MDPAQPMATDDQRVMGGPPFEKLLEAEVAHASGLWTAGSMQERVD